MKNDLGVSDIISNSHYSRNSDFQRSINNILSCLYISNGILVEGETGVGKTHLSDYICKQAINYYDELKDYKLIDAALINPCELENLLSQLKNFCDNETNRQSDLYIIDNLELASQASISVIKKYLTSTSKYSNTSPFINPILVMTLNSTLFAHREDQDIISELLKSIDLFKIEVPPLRNRTEDIESIIKILLEKFSNLSRNEITITPEVIELLTEFRWEQNILGLKKVLDDLHLLSVEENKRTIEKKDLDRLFNYTSQDKCTLEKSPINTMTKLSDGRFQTIFNGEPITLRRNDYIGQNYLFNILLKTGNKSDYQNYITTNELFNEKPTQYNFFANKGNDCNYLELSDFSPKNHHRNIEFTDPKTIRDTKNFIKELEIELEFSDDIEEKEVLEEEIKKHEEYLNKNSNIKGNPRTTLNVDQKIHKSVKKSIDDYFENVYKYYPEFYNYLKKVIVYEKHSKSYCYIPNEKITWTLENKSNL